MYLAAWVISLYVLLTCAAIANPILAYLNGNRSRLSVFILGTGLVSAAGLGVLFFVTYKNGLVLKAWALMGAASLGGVL